METTGRDSPRGRCSLRPLSSTRTSGRRAPAADCVEDIDIVYDIDTVDIYIPDYGPWAALWRVAAQHHVVPEVGAGQARGGGELVLEIWKNVSISV